MSRRTLLFAFSGIIIICLLLAKLIPSMLASILAVILLIVLGGILLFSEKPVISKIAAGCFAVYFGVSLIAYFFNSPYPKILFVLLIIADVLFIIHIFVLLKKREIQTGMKKLIYIFTAISILGFVISSFVGINILEILFSATAFILTFLYIIKSEDGIAFLIICQLMLVMAETFFYEV
jgi:hypothetical protein